MIKGTRLTLKTEEEQLNRVVCAEQLIRLTSGARGECESVAFNKFTHVPTKSSNMYLQFEKI